MKNKIKNKALNIFLAFFVSALVGAVGAVLWGVMYYNGIFASYVSFIAAFAMIVTFRFFWDNKIANYIWAFVFILLSSILACYLSIIFAIMKESSVSFAVAAKAFSLAFEVVKNDVFRDLGLCVLFDVLGVSAGIFTDISSRKNKKQIQTRKVIDTTVANVPETQETEAIDTNIVEYNEDKVEEQKDEIKSKKPRTRKAKDSSLEDKIHGK